MDKCAPGKLYDNNNGTCFTLNNLLDISIDFNKNFPNKSFEIKKNKHYLLKQLTSRMKNLYNCDNEVCWINSNFIRKMDNEDILDYTFKPEGTKGKYDWLSTTDIEKVMFQYEKKYNNFKFLGAVPYDFEDLPDLIPYNLNIKKILNNKKTQLGMVINLDPHYKSGSHWVSFFTNLKQKQVYFFDSYGHKPGKKIVKFVKKFYNDMKGGGQIQDSDLDIRYNKTRHQFNNSECGVYSMNFIIRLLNNESFDNITNNITKDVDMNACRKTYFLKE
jgi:hypothetical protein